MGAIATSFLRGLCLCSLVSLLGACATLPTDYAKPESFAVRDTAGTKLATQLDPITAQHPEKSGFRALVSGTDALVARAGLIKAAERTLDVQYYIWRTDVSGRVMVGLLLEAADRGVRVRILLDDLDTAGKDFSLAKIDRHPNIEIRLYNPFANRSARSAEFLTDLRRVNRRMHNKSLTADNRATIVGGRNIGNEYFGGKSATQFADFDVLAIGPIVDEVSNAFDVYWNSEWVFPVSAFTKDAEISEEELQAARDELRRYLQAQSSSPYALALQASELVQKESFAALQYVWGEASLLYDAPSKVVADEVTAATHIGPNLGKVFAAAKRELIVISPYFVPGDELVEFFGELTARGTRVRILTNSLAATDVGVVHAGYMRYRVDLLKNGVELYEFKPTEPGEGETQDTSWRGSSKASLHAKTFAVDRKLVFVGSFNLDPRSFALNTEMGVLFESAALAGQIGESFDRDLIRAAYRVRFKEHDGSRASEELEWVTEEDGARIAYDKEPETSWWQRFSAGFLSIFVPESML